MMLVGCILLRIAILGVWVEGVCYSFFLNQKNNINNNDNYIHGHFGKSSKIHISLKIPKGKLPKTAKMSLQMDWWHKPKSLFASPGKDKWTLDLILATILCEMK
jgi:hypothetical protein